MANNREKIFKKALELIPKHHLFFIEDVIAMLPISKPTFYDYFKIDSNELNTIKELLDIEKVNMKVKLRAKMYNSKTDTATLALYKLICSDEERMKLSQAYVDFSTQGESLNRPKQLELIISKFNTSKSD